GKDPQAVMAKAQADANKNTLRAQTEETQRRGIFGAPSFFAGDELFWGDDRLEAAIAWLKQGGTPA
ncbi:MAG: DsbA family protein, partial [Myxococcota bacterium]